jgi:hypothetical protein
VIALAVLVTLSQAADAEVFVDHSQVYVREGERAGLRAGNVVELLDASGKTVGKARVGEAYEALAKLDVDAKSELAKAKRARFGGISEPPLVDTSGQVVSEQQKRPEDLDRPPDEPGAPYAGDVVAERAEVGVDGGSGGMVGGATVNGFGALKRITVRNDSKFDWHACEVRLPTNKRYRLGTLQADSSEGILWFRFDADGVERDVPVDSVLMKCSEGWARFEFGL